LMKRPLFFFVLFYISGILLTASFGFLTSVLFISAALIFALIFFFRKTSVWILFLSFIFFTAGSINYAYSTEQLKSFYNFTLEEAEFTGVVVSEPEKNERTTNYVVEVLKIQTRDKIFKINKKILLTVYLPGNKTYPYGQYINFTCKPGIPEGQRNPGGFNYRNYLAQKKIYATAFVRVEDIKTIDKTRKNFIYAASIAVRNRIIESVNKYIPKQKAALLTGMITGYRENLSDVITNMFSETGLIHILSVSGLHVGFIILPLMFIAKKLRINRKFSNSLTILLLLFYCFITGFTASVVRAVIMAAAVLFGKIINREADVLTGISFAAFVILLYNPYSIYNVGFQLSFAATLSIVIFFQKFKTALGKLKFPGYLTDVVSVTSAAQLGILPLGVYYFNTVSLISIIANIIVLPFVQIALIIGIILIILDQINVFAAGIAAQIANFFISLILYSTEILSNLNFSSVKIITPPAALIILYYLILLYLRYSNKTFKYLKPTGLVFFLIYAVLLFRLICPPKLEVVFLDVGEGDSIFIKTASGKNILIDGGGEEGKRVVPDFLLDYGVWKLDLVISTHSHADHATGLVPVLENFRVRHLLLPGGENMDNFNTLLSCIDEDRTTVFRCFKGSKIYLDDKTMITFLNPDKNLGYSDSSLNNGSIVLKFEYMDTSILFCADIEKEVEALLAKNGEFLESDIIKIAHHGAGTSSTELFLDSVNPKAGIISVGKNNYGHPSITTLDRLTERGIVCLRTDRDGAVILKSDGKTIKINKICTGDLKNEY